MPTDLHHFINGERVAGASGNFSDVFNPATGEIIARTPLADGADMEKAIASAQAAFPEWSGMSALRRARVMFKYKELVEAHADELAELLGREHGKVLSDGRGSVQRGVETIEFACGIPHALKGEFSDNVSSGIDMYSMRKPLGVVAGITPFNFPAMVPMWMFVMGTACGNTFVLKPSEKDPSCPLRLAELFVEAGAPPGVLNVVNGDKFAVDTILEDPRIKAVSFVGSTPIAKYVYGTATANGKRCQAMGGAKNHMIIMPDADLDQTVDALVGAAYGSAGERCMAISVAVAVGGVGEKLVEMLKPRVESLRIGPFSDDKADLGPLITGAHRDKVHGYIEGAAQEGADLVVDGRGFSLQGYENGYFTGGTLVDQVTRDMTIYKEEVFGPVLSVMRVDDFDTALDLATSHQYGNGTSIFTRDGDVARAYADQVEVGMVGINVPIPVPMAFHTFGGWKDSAFGDQNQHGMEGVRFYTKVKTITSRWPTGIRAGADFNIPTLK